MDMQPSGPLVDYYPFDALEQASYLLFNSDEAFESIDDIEDSKLLDYITAIVGR